MPEFILPTEADRCPHCGGVLREPPNCCPKMEAEHLAESRRGYLAGLELIADAALVAEMPPGLKKAIDDALAAGCTPQWVLSLVRATAGGRTPTVLMVEAYLHMPQEG